MKSAKRSYWRVDTMRTIGQWASLLKRFFDAFSIVGGILLIAGLLLLVLAAALKVDWLRDAGGALFVAGLSLIISTSSGKEAVRQQNAKEANVRRKDEIYGPLYIELKQVWERLEEASRGKSSYPHWIQGVGEEPPPKTGVGSYYQIPTFFSWPVFKDDHRIDHFTGSARNLFNEVQQLAAAYNKTVAEALLPNRDILRPYLASAMETVMSTPLYQVWKAETEDGDRVRGPNDNWYERIDRAYSTPPSFPCQEEAKMWLDDFGALGWLLAHQPEGAASAVHEGYRYISVIPPSLTWFQEIFQLVWPELNELPVNQQARDAASALLKKVREAKGKVETGLRYIRDQYEGGEPPV